ncbi:MAG: acyl-CoA synthetase, partial [Microthrixaceae bacterium]|nr:acyl-CoA synthetase [Microthrixaceae bacterium]
ERVTAVVVAREGSSPSVDDLHEFVKGKIAGYKAPRGVVLVDEMVRSPSGKADYRWAKSQALAQESDD